MNAYVRNFHYLKMKITSIVENLLNHVGIFIPSDDIRDLALIHHISKIQIFHNCSMFFCVAFETSSKSRLLLQRWICLFNHISCNLIITFFAIVMFFLLLVIFLIFFIKIILFVLAMAFSLEFI